MKRLFFSILLGTTFLSPVLSAQNVQAQESCGDITIGALNWQSAEVLSYVHAYILEHGFGCNITVIASDTIPTITSMVERGQPDIIAEANIFLMGDLAARGLADGRIVALGDPLRGGTQEGWVIPKFIADAHPEIKTVGDALNHPELFPSPENAKRGAVLIGPEGWGASVVTEQLYKAYDANNAGFDKVYTGSAAGLESLMARYYETKTGYLTYYWSPTALMARYPMVRLEGDVEHDEEEWARCTTVTGCLDPKPNYWHAATPVYNLVTKNLHDRADAAVTVSYFEKQSWSRELVSELTLWMQDNQATGEVGALHFMRSYPHVWKEWVSEDVAARLEASL